MRGKVTLEKVERLALQLTVADQLKLLASISTQLSDSLIFVLPVDEEAARKAREAYAEALMQKLDAIANSIEIRGEIDSAEELRQIREERTGRI